MKKTLLTLLSMLCLAGSVWADDIDIYGVGDIDIKPNVLIIFDNSGSMGTQDVPGMQYDPLTAYAGSYNTNAVYDKNHDLWFSDINSANWQCAAAKSDLLTVGWWKGKLKKSNQGVVTCGGNNSRNYRLGNFENYDDLPGAGMKTRMEVAKEVIARLIDNSFDQVNFGLMKFNEDTAYQGGYIQSECGVTRSTLIGAYDPLNPPIYTDASQGGLGAIGAITSQTYTPLAETLAEAGRYFSGQKSWFNGATGKYTSQCTNNNVGCYDYSDKTPIKYRCQKNYIIVMTDGEPTQDDSKLNSDPGTLPYLIDKEGVGHKVTEAGEVIATSYLENVAYFLAHNDLRVLGANPTEAEIIAMGEPGDAEAQIVTTYTIGFQSDQTLLENTALNGGGEYYTADNADTLNEALTSIISTIIASNEGFSAAAVPVSRANKTYAGEYVYYGLFQPLISGSWVGNLKKYKLAGGALWDKNGNPAINATTGVVEDNAISFWSTSVDGPEVNMGGAGEKLLNDIQGGMSRNLYTYTGTSKDLKDATNNFHLDNKAVLNTYAGLSDSVINIIRREDGGWPLGDLLHSEPVVIHYDIDGDGADDLSVIFVGSNDGMLHAFDDFDGAELWGFIPPDLLDDKLEEIALSNKQVYSVDGSPTVQYYDHDGDKNILTPPHKRLIIGERRGGDAYSVLDVTDYQAPVFKYQIKKDVLGAGDETLGQSWVRPQLEKMIDKNNLGANPLQDFYLMSGGYDENQDGLPDAVAPDPVPNPTDSVGRAVFAINAQTGELLENFVFSASNYPAMTHSIIGLSAYQQEINEPVNRVYAGDMDGNMFAFRDDDIKEFELTPAGAQPKPIDVLDGKVDGNWSQKLKLFATPGKKIFYPPGLMEESFDRLYVTTEGKIKPMINGDFVYWGTGDRAHPERRDIVNGLYAIKNGWDWNGSETPDLVEAYVDKNDKGKIKAISDDHVLVEQLIDDQNTKLENVWDSGEKFILDVTYDLSQNREFVRETQTLYQNYAVEAEHHVNNYGWFIRFVEGTEGADIEMGEKVVSSPLIYDFVIYLTTYVPEDPNAVVAATPDPCANPGARGMGWIYMINARNGEAIFNLDPTNDDEKGSDGHQLREKSRTDRRGITKNKGIPPPVQIDFQEDGAVLLEGTYVKPVEDSPNMLRYYWRQIVTP
ncbi:MAG: hypothetical protein KKB30_10025 [Proteobacteria bacterium]|nr:hypothetical protein [Pseudomonadota bacterium]MBU1716387.1 hypothetical protein [Pseudomonadota bacterium]